MMFSAALLAMALLLTPTPTPAMRVLPSQNSPFVNCSLTSWIDEKTDKVCTVTTCGKVSSAPVCEPAIAK